MKEPAPEAAHLQSERRHATHRADVAPKRTMVVQNSPAWRFLSDEDASI